MICRTTKYFTNTQVLTVGWKSANKQPTMLLVLKTKIQQNDWRHKLKCSEEKEEDRKKAKKEKVERNETEEAKDKNTNNIHQTKILTNLLFFGITGWPLFFSNSLIAFSSSSLFFCKYSSLSFICLSLSIFFCFSLSIFSKPSLIHAGNCLLFAASGIMMVVFSYPWQGLCELRNCGSKMGETSSTPGRWWCARFS